MLLLAPQHYWFRYTSSITLVSGFSIPGSHMYYVCTTYILGQFDRWESRIHNDKILDSRPSDRFGNCIFVSTEYHIRAVLPQSDVLAISYDGKSADLTCTSCNEY